ncbi:MAG TPA: hypothetical protein PKD15_02135 [Candidatus Saccharibacteria bacterium]|jgi:hypothetical protein|nr:hypothetical protein [Candidatus Saccharibacteria bacterium]
MKVQKSLVLSFVVAVGVIGVVSGVLIRMSRTDSVKELPVQQEESSLGVLGTSVNPAVSHPLDIVVKDSVAGKGTLTLTIDVTNPTDSGIQFVPGIDLFARGSDGNTYTCRSDQEGFSGIVIPKETKSGVVVCDTSAFVSVTNLLYQPNNSSKTIEVPIP